LRKSCAGVAREGDALIQTERLRLIPCDESLLRAIVAGPRETQAHLGVVVPAGWPEFPDAYPHALERVQADGDLRPWWTYVFIDDRRGALVGSGGFAGRPTEHGVVELGYETAPPFRGHGYAREAASGLLAFAFGQAAIAAVDAHTLPERNASARVLEWNRFRHIGIVEHPDDGMIWHWRVTRDEWEAR
jgi:RimJ/RimL family protein N-acetyltransferase